MDRNSAEKPYPPPNPEGVGYGQPYPQNPPGYMPVPQGPPGPPGMPQQAGYPPPGPPPPGVQYNQQYPTTVVVQQPQVVVGPPPGPEPPSQMGCAVFVCLCCFCPTGLIAIFKAREARNSWMNGDALGAQSAADTARKLIIISFIIGIIFMVISIIIKVIQIR